MCSMRGGGEAGRKVVGVLMVAMLPGVEAAGLVRYACQTFGNGYFKAHFDFGCNFACGGSYTGGSFTGPTTACSATDRTPGECATKCLNGNVRHRPHLLLAPPASLTAALRVRFTTMLHTLVLVLSF